MVSKKAQNQVKETPMQPYQTIVSIEWKPCFVHRYSKLPRSMPTKIVQLLEQGQQIGVPLELSCQPKGNLAVQ